MLDPKMIKENPELLQKMLKERNVDFDLDGLVDSDKKRREFILRTDELRKKKNKVALEIAQKKKAGEDTTEILKEMKQVS
ncbi:MAG: serine--tRNA ligase, partial [Nitrosopumilaceae archaeon]